MDLQSRHVYFLPQEDTIIYTAVYDSYAAGEGSGLRGYYYDSPAYDPTFYEPYKFTWIDTTIDFDWGDGSPATSQIGYDFFLVRWEGYVEPITTGSYSFHVIADDGIRLWVDDNLLIDAWVPQPPTEWTGEIELVAGNKYPIRLEFFEEAYGAICKLFWSSSRISKSIIPRSQLYPEETTSVTDPSDGVIQLKIYPHPVIDILQFETADPLIKVIDSQIYNSLGQLMHQFKPAFPSDKIQIDVQTLAPGMFWLKCRLASGHVCFVPFVKVN